MLPKKSLFIAICIIFCFLNANAASYDRDILNTYSKLSARFILMSTQKTKITKTIEMCLVYEPQDKAALDEFISLTKENYPKGIKEHEIVFKKSTYDDFSICSASQLLFLFNTDKDSLAKSIEFSQEKKILTISYNEKYLEDGADISLFIGRKIVPFVNLQSIHYKGIELDNLLLQISKIFTKNEKGREL